MNVIQPNWQVPQHICALSSTRHGGVSTGVYRGLNLGMHVADEPSKVEENRLIISNQANMPSSPIWLNQTHSTVVKQIDASVRTVVEADGVVTSKSNLVCSVMTADCLPVLLTDVEGSKVAAVHAGWRGLANGILENALNQFDKPVIAWLGPAIGVNAFEVGKEVFQIFTQHSPQAELAFHPQPDGKYLADMPLLAQQRLVAAGSEKVYNSGLCTYSHPDDFYSYRRDGVTGRQASFIWIADK